MLRKKQSRGRYALPHSARAVRTDQRVRRYSLRTPDMDDHPLQLTDAILVHPSIERIVNRAAGTQRTALRRAGYGVDDILQDVRIRLIKRFPHYDSTQSFSKWVYMIARHHVVDILRKSSAHKRMSLSGAKSLDRETSLRVLDLAEGPVQRAERQDTIRYVRAAIRELTPGEQRVIELVELNGVPRAEAARRMGITEETFRYRHRKAMDRLRMLLERNRAA